MTKTNGRERAGTSAKAKAAAARPAGPSIPKHENKGFVSNTVLEQQRVADERREQVARMILMGYTVRQTCVALVKEAGIKSPDSKDGAWSVATVQRDIDALRAHWRENALTDITDAMGQQLAEIRLARKQAWSYTFTDKDGNVWQQPDLGEITRLLKLEIDLTGTAKTNEKIPDWRALALAMGVEPDALVSFIQDQRQLKLENEQRLGLPGAGQVVENKQ